MDSIQIDADLFHGTWRRFGADGPVYEIIGLGRNTADDARTMRIRLVKTGEELDYRLSELLDDPKEL